MESLTTKKVGLIVGSQRLPRAGPQVATFVLETIQPLLSTPESKNPSVELTTIDLKEWNLPMFDEPTIPQRIYKAEDYVQPHAQAWSREVSKYDGFIFVTPQYNWGYPASLKNAIDYLFNEWKGKPAMIVSYGGRGGFKAAAQLVQVLQGVDMKPIEAKVPLSFPSKEILAKASKGDDLGLAAPEGIWESEREAVRTAFRELLSALSEGLVEIH